MFSEDLDWDVPENIQSLNRVVFHVNIPGNNRTGRIKKRALSATTKISECVNDVSVASSQSELNKRRTNKKLGEKKDNISAINGDVESHDRKTSLESKTLKSNNKKERSSQKVSNSKALGSLKELTTIIDDKTSGSAQSPRIFNSKNCSESSQLQKLTDKLSQDKAKDRVTKCKKKEYLTNGKLDKCKEVDKRKHSVTQLSAELCEGNTQKISEQFKSKSPNGDESIHCTTKSMSKKLVKRKGINLKSEPICKKSKTDDVSNIKDSLGPPLGKRRIDVNRLKMHLKNAKQREQHIDEDDKMVTGTRQEPTLNNRMLCQLNSARFRFINEQLYTCSGNDAAEMFTNDRESFDVYHTGFQSQVDKWPVNPVDVMVDYIRHCDKSAVVADFGCGDAKIARSLPNVVHSFDLVALNSHVTACDITHVPLRSSSVDIVVFCLSLMGTNLVEYLCEASRVMKIGATLLIAEVVSRFEKVGRFVKKLHKLGFSLVNKDADNKMFVWFEFAKTAPLPPKDQLPAIELLPCVYKKR